MDEEFFFPQNVRTSYRLFMLGPTHLKRLVLAPVIALAAIIGLYRISLFLGVGAGVLLAAIYAGLCCIPLMGDDQTMLDMALEIRRHQRSQGRYRNRREVNRHGVGPDGAA
jgi:hypothetical protein